MFTVDSHYVIGRDHVQRGKPCQDNAYVGSMSSGEAAVAVVSDGCSSGNKTEFGAMFSVISVAKAVGDHWAQKRNAALTGAPLEIREREKALLASSLAYGIGSRDLLATSVYAYLSPEGGFAHADGDGVIAWKTRNGHVHMVKYEWAGNRPFYPVYNLSDGMQQSWIKAHGGDVNAICLTVETWEYVPGGMVQKESRNFALGEGMRGDTLVITKEQLAAIEFVAVFSDGVMQVDGYDWKDVVVQLLGFKAKQGVFAVRRMNAFLADATAAGEGPADDLSYAVIQNVAPPQGGAP